MSNYEREVVAPGDRVSKRFAQIAKGTDEYSPAVTVSSGRGFRSARTWIEKPHVLEAMLRGTVKKFPQNDGAGNKPQFFTLLNQPDAFGHLFWEIIAMTADDVAARGGLPILINSTTIDTKSINEENWHLWDALLAGVENILRKVRMPLITGETAVMQYGVTAFCDTKEPHQLILNWAGDCMGLSAKDMPENGSTITPNMVVIGFRSNGYRCNGGTKLIEIILQTWGPDIKRIQSDPDAMAFVRQVVAPSRSYARTISRLNGWKLIGLRDDVPHIIHGCAHITGGGIASKLGEILPEGIGVKLHAMPVPPTVLLEAQELSQATDEPMSDRDCFKTFHGGCDMLLVCEDQHAGHILREARRDGHDASVVGETFPSNTGEIWVRSQFMEGGDILLTEPA